MTVRVGIDSRSLRRGPPGVATVVRNLLAHIPQLMPFDAEYPKNNFLWNQFCVPIAALRMRWDLFHAPSYTSPLLNPCPCVLSVHDVSYLVSDDLYPNKLDPVRRKYYLLSMKRSARIIVPSEFSRQEVIRFLPQLEPRVRKVSLGVSPEFIPNDMLSEKVTRRLDLPERFLLHVGDIHPRRNIGLISTAGRILGLPLVLVGRPLQGAVVERDEARILSGVSQQELVGIYNAATVFVYPSVYEGFGLPILEAMACGLPVVAANRASIPEVCGDAALLVEPEAEAILEGIRRVLDAREEYRARGLERARSFSWEATAEKTVRVYQELL